MQPPLGPDVTTRHLQALGALLVDLYCKAKGIESESIATVTDSLRDLLTTKSLTDWEQSVRQCDAFLSGDALPASIGCEIKDPLIRVQLELLLNNVTEISMIDM